MRNNNLSGEPGNVLHILVWKGFLAWLLLLGKKEQQEAGPRVLPLSSITGSFKHITDYNLQQSWDSELHNH